VLRDALLSESDWEVAGWEYAREHDRYFGALSRYIGWVRELMHTSGPEAEARRAKALPAWERDPSRNPLLNVRGPDIEVNDEVRRRFFDES